MTADERRRAARTLTNKLIERLPITNRDEFMRALRPRRDDDIWAAVEYAPYDMAPHVVVAFYLNGLQGKPLQAPLTYAWLRSHQRLKAAAADRKLNVIDMFRDAAFPIPDTVPETVTVWRGSRDVTREIASQGASWTDTRLVAIAYTRGGQSPILLRRSIPRSSIVFAVPTGVGLTSPEGFTGREIDMARGLEIVFDLAPGGDVDGCQEGWQSDWNAAQDDAWATLRGEHALCL
jgi:hypothetical protein